MYSLRGKKQRFTLKTLYLDSHALGVQNDSTLVSIPFTPAKGWRKPLSSKLPHKAKGLVGFKKECGVVSSKGSVQAYLCASLEKAGEPYVLQGCEQVLGMGSNLVNQASIVYTRHGEGGVVFEKVLRRGGVWEKMHDYVVEEVEVDECVCHSVDVYSLVNGDQWSVLMATSTSLDHKTFSLKASSTSPPKKKQKKEPVVYSGSPWCLLAKGSSQVHVYDASFGILRGVHELVDQVDEIIVDANLCYAREGVSTRLLDTVDVNKWTLAHVVGRDAQSPYEGVYISGSREWDFEAPQTSSSAFSKQIKKATTSKKLLGLCTDLDTMLTLTQTTVNELFQKCILKKVLNTQTKELFLQRPVCTLAFVRLLLDLHDYDGVQALLQARVDVSEASLVYVLRSALNAQGEALEAFGEAWEHGTDDPAVDGVLRLIELVLSFPFTPDFLKVEMEDSLSVQEVESLLRALIVLGEVGGAVGVLVDALQVLMDAKFEGLVVQLGWNTPLKGLLGRLQALVHEEVKLCETLGALKEPLKVALDHQPTNTYANDSEEFVRERLSVFIK